MSKKTVVSVELLCSRCRLKVMKLISTIEGISSISLDPSKNTATVIGEADPVCIIKNVRKFRKTAQLISIGPVKEEKKDEKKEFHVPKTCHKCDVWYYPIPIAIHPDSRNHCYIL
ncbi:heavy metal-associated isoprenylated plant protein 2-like [Impatiens glandulifera]|uniref:heavy metal-associated isoprenylated plant protein 2-like n=1 Tax=Impatiens glandulifera TaxID=253017 RepID=UPI001FB137A8|nr:heavy metal-associated isoprenylated plant protein 2-like [Impatiens glandulifera]